MLLFAARTFLIKNLLHNAISQFALQRYEG